VAISSASAGTSTGQAVELETGEARILIR
jgi:hypothetical protein